MRLLSSTVISSLALMMFAVTTPMWSQTSSDSDARELQRLEDVWNEAHEYGNADALDALWADDGAITVPKMPMMSKTDALKFARSGRMKFIRYQTSEILVRVYGDAAVVTGRLQRTRLTNGQETSDNWRFTKT